MEVTVFGILIDSSGIQKRKRGKPDWPSPSDDINTVVIR